MLVWCKPAAAWASFLKRCSCLASRVEAKGSFFSAVGMLPLPGGAARDGQHLQSGPESAQLLGALGVLLDAGIKVQRLAGVKLVGDLFNQLSQDGIDRGAGNHWRAHGSSNS